MKKILSLLTLLLFLNCLPSTYFLGSKAEFLSFGYEEKQIKKIVVIEKGKTIYKIYYKE